MLTPDRWREIEELYRAAQNCAPGERAALLDGADPEIRARVERMLEIESSGGLLDQSPSNMLADPTQTVIARSVPSVRNKDGLEKALPLTERAQALLP